MADKPKKLSNFIKGNDEKMMDSYIRTVDNDLQRLFTYLDTFPRQFEQGTQPTIQRNTFAFWKDTDDDKYYLLCDINGTTKKVELI